jgi:hypothetical protein
MSHSKTFVQKNARLHLEFDMLLFSDFELQNLIPNGSHLIVTIDGDEKFNAASRALVRNVKPAKVVEAHKSHGAWSVRQTAVL